METSGRYLGLWLIFVIAVVSGCGGTATSNPNAPSPSAPTQGQPSDTVWDQWDVPLQTYSGTGSENITISANANYPRLITFKFSGNGWHWATMSEANISVGTEEGRAAVVWDPLFGNTTTVKIESSGAWSMNVQSLSRAPTWELDSQLTITDENAVFKVSESQSSVTSTTSIIWKATGCPVSTEDKRVWIPGGGGINGTWSTELGEKRGASIILQYIYQDGQFDWSGDTGGSWDSQSPNYSGSATPLGKIVAIRTFTNCEKLILDAGQ